MHHFTRMKSEIPVSVKKSIWVEFDKMMVYKRLVAAFVVSLFSLVLCSFGSMPAMCDTAGAIDPTYITGIQSQVCVPVGPYSVVNTASGRLITTIPIVSWKTRGGMSIDFTLTHISGDTMTDATGYGLRPANGWRHSYQSWVIHPAGCNNYDWVRSTESYRFYDPATGGFYARNHGCSCDLSSISGGGYRLTTKDQTKYDYTDPDNTVDNTHTYYLEKITDMHNNQIDLAYLGGSDNNSDLVTRIYDPTDERYLRLTWQISGSSKRLGKVEVWRNGASTADREWTFNYDSSVYQKLIKIRFPEAVSGSSSTRPYVEFDYSNGCEQITAIRTPANNITSSGSENEWVYEYSPIAGWENMVTQVTGPESDNIVSFTSGSKAVGSVNYSRAVMVRDKPYDLYALQSGATDYREVHLYLKDSDARWCEIFGPMISYVVDPPSKTSGGSTWDSQGSSWDSDMSSAFPGCYYQKYVWDTQHVMSDGTTHRNFDGSLTAYTDASGNTWTCKWYSDSLTQPDGRKNLWKFTDPLSKTIQYTYDSHNKCTQITDQLGRITTNSYDSTTYDLETTTVDPSNANLTTQYDYYSNGNLRKVTDPYNTVTETTYDSTYQAYPITVENTNTDVFTESGGYDVLGNPSWTRAPRKTSGSVLETSYTYDGLGRLKRVTNPDTTFSETTYDLNGNKKTVTDANGNVVSYHYDSMGHVDTETHQQKVGTTTQDVVTTYDYNSLGLLDNVEWERGGVTKQIDYDYDTRKDLIKETFPGTQPLFHKYYYNGYGKPRKRIEGNNSTTRTFCFLFDELGRPTENRLNSTTGTLLTKNTYYDNNAIKQIDRYGSSTYSTKYYYDTANRLSRVYQSYPNKSVQYDYQKSPHKETANIREGDSATGTILGSYASDYATGGNLQYLTSPTTSGPKTEYVYNDTYGMLSQVNYNINAPLGAAPHTLFDYDTANKKRFWVSRIGNYRSDGSLISSFDYEHDYVGNRTKMYEEKTSSSYNACTEYAYDPSYQLLSETRKNSTGSQIYKYEYQYDEPGNRTLKKLTNSTYTSGRSFINSYVDNNLIQSVTVSGTTYASLSHDTYGRMITKDPYGSSNTWGYTYDDLDKLTQATRNSTSVATFKYDGLGHRIERADSAHGTTKYVYNGDSLIAETNSSNSIIAWYTPGICETRYIDSKWQTFYYQCDDLGSTKQLTDSMQRITDAYAYNAWGEQMGEMDAPANGPNPDNPLKFVGKLGCYSDKYTTYSDDTGLVLMGARYYDPLIGRFITQDPSRDGLNWYEYAGNNPVNAVDPTGKSPIIVGAVIIGGAVAEWQLNDWGTHKLNKTQTKQVNNLVDVLKEAAKTENMRDLSKNLKTLRITNQFDSVHDAEEDSSSESRASQLFGLRGQRTILSADFFKRSTDPTENLKSQLTTLLHESYHTGKHHWTDDDNKAYDYGRNTIDKLWPTIIKIINNNKNNK